MSIDITGDHRVEAMTPITSVNRLDQAARWISNLAAPPVLGIAAAVLCARSLGSPAAWAWLSAYLAVVVAIPVAYLGWLLARGQVSDVHLHRREERLRPYLVTVAVTVLAWWAMRWAGAPRLLVVLAAATCLQTGAMFAVTLRWKISAHSAGIAGLAVLAWALGSPLAWTVAAAVPLVGWARLRLRRHTVAQVMAGAAVGGLGLATALLLSCR